jgi:hypothetical protein
MDWRHHQFGTSGRYGRSPRVSAPRVVKPTRYGAYGRPADFACSAYRTSCLRRDGKVSGVITSLSLKEYIPECDRTSHPRYYLSGNARRASVLAALVAAPTKTWNR